jgi:hypothetical protein
VARASARATGQPSRADPSGRLVWLQGAVAGGILALAPSSAALLVVLLAPAGLAFWLDREPGRPIARAVAVCTLAGAIDPLVTLWNGGRGMQLVMALLADPFTMLPAWGAAGAGWLLAELGAILFRLGLDIAARAQASRLRAERARLEQDWGLAADDNPD